MPFKCSQCDRVLPTSQGLKIHSTKIHGKEDPVSSSLVDPAPVSSGPVCPPLNPDLISLLGNLRGNTKIIGRIPKGARPTVADALSNTIDTVVRDNSTPAWERLLLFAPSCLKVPLDKANRSTSLSSLVSRNTSLFLQGHTPSLSLSRPPSPSLRRPFGEDPHFARRVDAKVADGDIRGAVRLLSSEDSFAPFNPDTKSALQALHPSQGLPFSPSPSPPTVSPLQASVKETRGAISSFAPGSAGGPDMLRPQHLKDLSSPALGNPGIRLLSSVTRLCNLMLMGEVPANIRPILYGASLCALSKKNGGIRPIAIGCTWRRLVAKMGSFHLVPSLSTTFQPIQLGFGIKGGAEAAAHAARRYISFPHASPKVFLKIDFRNAFNSIDRNLLLHSVQSQIPSLFPFLAQCYGSPSHLSFGDCILSSEQGIQQGDPLGPALFCLMVHPLASSVSSELNLWYLDDASLGGPPEVVAEDFKNIKSQASALGLEVNSSKCELFGINGVDAHAIMASFPVLPSNTRLPPLKDCTLLGAPLVPSAIMDSLSSKTAALARMADRLLSVGSHVGFFLLKNTQAIPKLSYVLRCAPTWTCVEGLVSFDNTLRRALEAITNTRLEEDAWQQASLPIALGGLGIRHAHSIAVPAFLASVHSASTLVNSLLPPDVSALGDPSLSAGISTWQTSPTDVLPPLDKRSLQSEWESTAVSRTRDLILEQAASSLAKARLLGVASRESGAFLDALPSPHLGTLIDDDSFRVAIALRLGSAICQAHTCSCGAQVDPSGVHGLSCPKAAGRRSRHAAVNDLIRRGLGSANIPSALEPPFLAAGDNKRPDGITQVPWSQGKSMVWDFTCTNGMAPSHVAQASIEPLFAATVSETNKLRKYAHLSDRYTFIPLAVECLGSFAKNSLSTLKEIGKKIAEATGEKKATCFFLQRISIAVQRGNAACILGTIPFTSRLEDVFSLL